jgi:AAHS family 4-hydroxybenzoate transporter-like MFS transporter
MSRPDPAHGRTIDVAGIIERRRFDGFNIRLVLISWLITVFDGFDMMVVAFTAPYIKEELGLSNSELATIFSAGLLGMTLGAIAFSALSDRIGRRPVAIGTAVAFGVLTIATAGIQDYQQLLILRFIDGLAIGGMVPIAWALNVEFVSTRVRATVVTVIMVGYSVGTSGAGPATILLEPLIGWRGLYVAGGAGSLLAAMLLLFWLPESVRLLVSKGRSPDKIADMINRLDPSQAATIADRFILGDEAETPGKVRVGQLFAGDLRLLTPLLWLGFMASSIAIYFVNSWGPILLEALRFDRSTAALATAFGGIMGSVAGLAIMRFTDRLGSITLIFYPLLLLPVLLVIGFADLPAQLLLWLAMLVLMLVGGMHFAVMSIIGSLYPTAIRGSGSGWASSIGKLGGVLGPMIGGALLASGMPVTRTYLVLAICPAVVVICSILIFRRRRGR